MAPATGRFPGRKETSRNRSVIHRLVVVYQEYQRDRVGSKTEGIIPSSRVILIIVLVLAFSRLAFSGEIHDAARSDDLEKAQELLAKTPAWSPAGTIFPGRPCTTRRLMAIATWPNCSWPETQKSMRETTLEGLPCMWRPSTGTRTWWSCCWRARLTSMPRPTAVSHP